MKLSCPKFRQGNFWAYSVATLALLASLSGCSDDRTIGLHQGLLQTQGFLSTDCPQHQELKNSKDHLCILSVQEIPTK